MVIFTFTDKSYKTFLHLEKNIKERIAGKLTELKNHPDIFSVLKVVTNLEPATYRLRIGNYRMLIMQKSENTFSILKLGHRREIYR